jgi:hypothetical protein
MKRLHVAAMTLAAMLCTGCSGVIFTSPLVGPGEAIREDSLVGSWATASDPKSVSWIIRRAGERYSLWDSVDKFQKNEPPKDLAVTKVGGRTFFQVSDDCTQYPFFTRDPKQVCYVVYIAEINNGNLRYWALDEKRLEKDSSEGRLNVEHELRVNVTKSDKDFSREACVVLKGATENLRTFLASYAHDASIWASSPGELRKVSNAQ